MNLWTLAASVQGHCEYLKERFPETAAIHVVLAYDVRQFEDKRKQYNSDLPNPVLHLSSRDLARHAAGVYAANGIHAHVLPPDSKHYLATPELSFTIRILKAHGGLNISASHNPPDDNGGKFYDERGGQPVPPDDQIMADLVDQVTHIKALPWAEAVRSGRVHFLDEAPHRAYIDLCRKQSVAAAAAARRGFQDRLHAAARRRRHDRDGSARRPGLPRPPRGGADDAGRPVPQRHEDAEPRSPRVDGPGRRPGRSAQGRPGPRPPTRTPTASGP